VCVCFCGWAGGHAGSHHLTFQAAQQQQQQQQQQPKWQQQQQRRRRRPGGAPVALALALQRGMRARSQRSCYLRSAFSIFLLANRVIESSRLAAERKENGREHNIYLARLAEEVGLL